jgi:hypothetical protein
MKSLEKTINEADFDKNFENIFNMKFTTLNSLLNIVEIITN